MEKIVSRLTVLFADPFWIGIYEREQKGQYEACKMTFGAEPKDYEVYEYLLREWNRLRFSPSIEVETGADRRISPKRMQKLASRQTADTGIGT
ncbi:MAG: DUF2992 family protein, partial [Lachnospiraceae bacterium]|nr:DUF2992 family protein [Lachnospiraceae bacterium]